MASLHRESFSEGTIPPYALRARREEGTIRPPFRTSRIVEIRRRPLAAVTAITLVVVGLSLAPAAADPPVSASSALWNRATGTPAPSRAGHPAAIHADSLRTFTLDHAEMRAALEGAPAEYTPAAERHPLVLSVPAPAGGFQRFALQESPVMEPGLAARHPEITTYSGEGIDDPTATIRVSSTPLGFQASVRGAGGTWYVDPYYHLDRSLYATYFGRDLEDRHGTFVERGLEALAHDAAASAGSSEASVEVLGSTGDQLRTYRLGLVTDPSYATFFDPDGTQPANVTAAKVALVNRVTQIYEDETSIRLVLAASNDLLNLDTPALATGPNGPCGAAACFTVAQLASCGSGLLTRNRIVVGQIIGASNYDIGHIGLGKAGGGIASLGVVGRNNKAQGCTGIPQPVGDFFAVDYVAHEMGHQFAGNHTFNGTQNNCSGTNRNPGTSVEPGSGSSIMAYAGICRQDDLQPHSDPYWSQRSFDEITTYTSSNQAAINEVQNVALRAFDGTESFRLSYNGMESPDIVRGSNYSAAGIDAAILAIPGWPAGGDPTVTGFAGGTFDDTGFQVTFGGSLALMDAASFGVVPVAGDVTGFSGETAKGGPVDNKGSTVVATGNTAPDVTAPSSFTIPYRTPFALTGSATDVDGDTPTYLWEQNNAGAAAGTALTDPVKTNGPLFRQFGTALQQPPYDPTLYDSPGENHPTMNPTRVFPDMAQILANNTNAETGICPGWPPPPPPTEGGTNVPAALIECQSEFLPTPVYSGPMLFRLTARDQSSGGGGVNSDDTTVNLAPATGPFRVTSPNTAVDYDSGSTQTVTWDVAATSAAPISAASVDILLSTDGGQTFPTTLAPATPNDGSQDVVIPAADTNQARIQIRAVGNIFFDVSNEDFAINNDPPVATNDAPPGGVSVSQGKPLSPTVTVSASDPDSFGSALVATPAGLPAGLTLTTATTSPDATLPGTRTWTVTGTATADPGTYDVTVTVSDGFSTDITELSIIVRAADLSVEVSVSPGTGRIGTALTYTVTVRNTGPAAEPDVQVANDLPADVLTREIVTGPGEACTRSGSDLSCELGSLTSGGSADYRFVIVPAARGQVRHTATATGSEADPGANNDTAKTTTAVKAPKCTIKGTSKDDTLQGTRGRDVICGRGGDDKIRGRGGHDVIVGGGGNDVLRGSRGDDVVDGRAGNDKIVVRDRVGRNDAALGGSGSDRCASDSEDLVLSCP